MSSFDVPFISFAIDSISGWRVLPACATTHVYTIIHVLHVYVYVCVSTCSECTYMPRLCTIFSNALVNRT